MCNFRLDSSVWLLILKASICVLVFPTFAFICIAQSRVIVSIYRCFVSSALQLFASTASVEYTCPIVSGCAHFITGHVVTPHSFVPVSLYQVWWYAMRFLHLARVNFDMILSIRIFILFCFSHLFLFREKCLLHMYMKIWFQFLPETYLIKILHLSTFQNRALFLNK